MPEFGERGYGFGERGYGNENKTDSELLEEINVNLEDQTEYLMEIASLILEGGIEGAGSSAGGSGGMKESVGTIEKVFKSLGKTLKKAPAIFLLEQLMKLLEPFLALLEPIAVIFDILGGLFSILAGEILKELFAALQPLFDLLIDLAPIFKIVGRIIALVVKVGLIPLKVIFEVIGAILKPFMPLLEKFSPILEVIGTVLSWVIRVGMLPLILAIYGIGLAIAALINFFTFGLVDAIGAWNGIMLPVMASMVTMAEGGIVTKPTLALIGEGGEPEQVTPLSKSGSMGFGGDNEIYLIEMNESLGSLVQMQRRQSRGIQRRRFG